MLVSHITPRVKINHDYIRLKYKCAAAMLLSAVNTNTDTETQSHDLYDEHSELIEEMPGWWYWMVCSSLLLKSIITKTIDCVL